MLTARDRARESQSNVYRRGPGQREENKASQSKVGRVQMAGFVENGAEMLAVIRWGNGSVEKNRRRMVRTWQV